MTLTEFRSPYIALMGEIGYPEASITALTEAFDAICQCEAAESVFDGLLARYEADMRTDFRAMLGEAAEAGKQAGLHEYTSHLVLLTLLALILRRFHAEAGLDDAIYVATAKDLTWKLLECRAVKGIDGTFVADWFSGAFHLDRFALGRLQFELMRLGLDFEEDGKVLTPDSTVINIHIPRTGGPMSPDLVQDALDRAAAFYGPQIPQGTPIAFHCSSWLLYKGHLDYLPPRSNVRSFMDRFHIVKSHANAPGENGDLWRLFDCDYDGNPDHLPADSSLRRGYIAMLKDGVPTGHGKGILFY